MKKIGCISQTYGNERIHEIKCIVHDDTGGALRDLLDEISFTFHNCNPEIIAKSHNILTTRFPTCKFRSINNVNYRDSIIQQLCDMKNMGLTDFVLLQDDHYGINYPENVEYVKSIVAFYKSRPDIKYLHLHQREGYPSANRVPKETVEYSGLLFHKYDSRDFKKDDFYGYNDGIFIASIDMFIDILKTNGVPEDVWGVELWLKWLFDNYEHDRWGIEKVLFDSVYMHGRNTSTDLRGSLNCIFGMKPNFEEIIKP